MTHNAQRLLDLLVRQIGDGLFIPDEPETYLGYKKAHGLLGLPRRGPRWGRSLQQQGLDDLADWIQRKHLPAVTGLIVDTTKKYRPGPGYFRTFHGGNEDYNWWLGEVRRAIGYDWAPYSTPEELPTPWQIQNLEALYSEGKKANIEAKTRERCEALIRRAKSFFRAKATDGELHCVSCGWSRPRVALRGDIVEVHHLHPMSKLPPAGVEWTFAEALKHLAPLCPNCHRVAHARPDGGVYSIEELKRIVR